MIKKIILLLVITAMMFTNSLTPQQIKAADLTEVFAHMRIKRMEFTAGGDSDIGDPDIKQKIDSVTNSAQKLWDEMVKTDDRDRLWSDLSLDTTESGIDMQTTFQRMRSLSTAYQVKGSPLYKNPTLKKDIVEALTFLAENVYNTNFQYVNNGKIGWYYWELGSPLSIVECLVLMYDEIPSSLISHYVNSIKYFSPDIMKMNFGGSVSTGANLVWRCTVAILSGVLVQDESLINEAVFAMSDLFRYADDYDLDDGFYRDGSFIQHKAVSYNGAYGLSMFGQVIDLLYLLEGSPFMSNNPDSENIYDWAYNGFAPILYNGSLMDMTRGRTISRSSATDRSTGREAMRNLFKLSLVSSDDDKIKLQKIIKQNVMVNEDETQKFINGLTLSFIPAAKEMLYGEAVPKESFSEMAKVYSAMDRAVYRNQNFGFGISMFSQRQHSYELTSVSVENKRGFYTGFGATYLYNNDFMHYSNAYWPTVNPYLLAGTTVTDEQLPDSFGANRYGTRDWVGGVTLDGKYGMVGMELEDYRKNSDISPMTAKKSWFMLDNQIVALGADINNENKEVEVRTVVENRNVTEDNVITIDGVTKVFGEQYNPDSSKYVHIAGEKTNIGYFFPSESKLSIWSGPRKGTWQEISNMTNPTDVLERNYFTITTSHGMAPKGATYAYVLLPGRSAEQVAAYAANPQIEILENSGLAAAVRGTKLNVTGANFWSDQKHKVGPITSSGKASVLLQEWKGLLKLSVSDPTQNGEKLEIEVEPENELDELVTNDSSIEVLQTTPTLKVSIDLSNAKGQGQSIVFKTVDYDEDNKDEQEEAILKNIENVIAIKTGSRFAYANQILSPINATNVSVTPILENSRTLVPVRFLVSSLGIRARWDNEESAVYLQSGDMIMKFKVGSKEVVINGEVIVSDAVASVVDGSVYVPIRLVADEMIDKKLTYVDGMIVFSDKETEIDQDTANYLAKMFDAQEYSF